MGAAESGLMEFLGDVIEWFADPEHWSGPGGIPARTLQHLGYSGLALVVASVIALPLGLYVGHTRKHEFLVVSLATVWRALPSLAVLGVVFILLVRVGLGFSLLPTLIALVVLAVPPIVTNSYVAIQGVDPDTIEAARGMGMSEGQILRRIEIPLGMPLMLTGLRTAALQVVATATLAAEVAAGGLGRFIVDGFRSGTYDQVFAGATLVALLAIVTEIGFGLLARVLQPKTGSDGRPPAMVSPAVEPVSQMPTMSRA